MIFQNLRLREKVWLLLFLLLLFCWWVYSAPVTCAAGNVQRTYTVTEQELNQLETNLTKLEQISVTQQQELGRLKTTLATSKQELGMLKNQLSISKEQLTQAQTSLDKANQLLKQYANEEKRTRLRIKAQRNFWIGVAITTLTVAIYVHNR